RCSAHPRRAGSPRWSLGRIGGEAGTLHGRGPAIRGSAGRQMAGGRERLRAVESGTCAASAYLRIGLGRLIDPIARRSGSSAILRVRVVAEDHGVWKGRSGALEEQAPGVRDGTQVPQLVGI